MPQIDGVYLVVGAHNQTNFNVVFLRTRHPYTITPDELSELFGLHIGEFLLSSFFELSVETCPIAGCIELPDD